MIYRDCPKTGTETPLKPHFTDREEAKENLEILRSGDPGNLYWMRVAPKEAT